MVKRDNACHPETTDLVSTLRLIGVALLFIFIAQVLLKSNYWLFTMMFVWQWIHMYVIGRRDITLGSFDGVDLVCGCFAIYFFWQAPLAYILMAGLVCLLTGKGSARR